MKLETLEQLAKLIRYYILLATTEAGSGHPTSSLSAVELMAALLFGDNFSFDLENPGHPNNDRLIFSKGHASPLFYSLYCAAGKISEAELKTFRKFDSRLEGHPTLAFPYTEVATGSLGQGLSIGVGLAMNAKYIDKLPYKTFVLIGDSEMAEGSGWEAVQIAAHYKLNNLVGIIDVNRLGQSDETMYGHDIAAYDRMISAFGWRTIVIEGHSFPEVLAAYTEAAKSDTPVMIIARTLKGKGVSFVEDKEGWHGKPLSRDQFEQALEELGQVDKNVRGLVRMPEDKRPSLAVAADPKPVSYSVGQSVATRKAYGNALVRLYPRFPEMVVLDAEVNNSTYTDMFKDAHPDRFFQMYIAEQNMVGASIGFSARGKLPFVSTFATFFARAYDQIRMSQYSNANIKLAGSHAGVSIGEDGSSQMGLADIALYRTISGSTVVYPADAVSTEKLVEQVAVYKGMAYLRLTRQATPVLYENGEVFPLGGSKTLRDSERDQVAVVAAGITLHEALAAYEELKREDVYIRVIDLYSIKPIDVETLQLAAQQTSAIITVEDHFAAGGLGEAVICALAEQPMVPIHVLAVRKTPKSGSPRELLNYEAVSSQAITEKVRAVTASR